MAEPATRYELSATANARLRRYALLGVSLSGMITGAVGAAIVFADGALDAGVSVLYLPDIVMGFVTLWQVLIRKRLDTAVRTYAGYLALNYGFLALQDNGLAVFQTAGCLLLPIIGFYLGGRRLGLIMSAALALETVTAAVVHMTGIGHHLVGDLPLQADTGALIMMAISMVEVLVLVAVFELRRDRTRVELDLALAELDNQSQTMVALIESTRDIIVLVDEHHRVVLHNRAASDLVPGLTAGALAPDGLVGNHRAAWFGWLDTCAREGHARVEHSVAGCMFEMSFSRVATADRVIGFTLIARDITARREAEAALRKVRGQLLETSRRAGIAETAAALVHGIGNALNGATVSSGVIAEAATSMRVENLRRAIDEVDAGALERADQRAATLRAYLRALTDHFAERKAALIHEARSLSDSLDEVTAALAKQNAVGTTLHVFDDVSLDEIVESALTADDCKVTKSLSATSMIVTDRTQVVSIVAQLFSVCRGDGMHVRMSDVADHVELAVSPHTRTASGSSSFAHGKPLHTAALAASRLGGSLRYDDEGERESFVLELPRVATTRAA